MIQVASEMTGIPQYGNCADSSHFVCCRQDPGNDPNFPAEVYHDGSLRS